jgi:glutamyl/glutaminyl-tRNA synthetase
MSLGKKWLLKKEQKTESQIPKNVSSIEIPDPLSDFMVSFKVENETREIYVKKDTKGVPYIFLNNQKGKRLKRNEVESFARKYVGDDLVDFMLEWKSLSKEEQSIIHYHTLGVPFRSMQDKDFYTPKTVEEINKEYENEVSSKIKQGVDKYLKPFVKATLEERLEKTKKQVNKAKLEKTKQKNSTLVADIEKAIAKLTQSQTGKIKPESEFVLLMQNEKKEKELLAKLESLQEELPELEFNLDRNRI